MTPLGCAFVGTGTVSHLHARAVVADPAVRLCGAWDPNGLALAAFVQRFGGRAYRDLGELLADRQVEAVHVLTPEAMHAATAIRCLEAGKHVLVEKPVARTRGEIAALRDAARRSGRVCMPAHNYIYAPALRRAKRLLSEGRLGTVASLWILYNIFHAEEVAAIYGGILRAVCVHHAYSLLFLLGKPQRLAAVASKVRGGAGVSEEQVMLVASMSTGAIANLWASFLADDPTEDPWTVSYKILGSKGAIHYSWRDAVVEAEGGPGSGMVSYVESFARRSITS
jgi:predicted dehydrogenase